MAMPGHVMVGGLEPQRMLRARGTGTLTQWTHASARTEKGSGGRCCSVLSVCAWQLTCGSETVCARAVRSCRSVREFVLRRSLSVCYSQSVWLRPL
eukprot:5996772-Heterocapsa_arctica.AAC.1